MQVNTGRGTIPLITLIGIWSISALTSLPGLAVSPILGQLSSIFPKATELDIQMLASLPSLLIIPFVLLAGKLAENGTLSVYCGPDYGCLPPVECFICFQARCGN